MTPTTSTYQYPIRSGFDGTFPCAKGEKGEELFVVRPFLFRDNPVADRSATLFESRLINPVPVLKSVRKLMYSRASARTE